VRGGVFAESEGFDESLTFDDEVIGEEMLVSDGRYRERGLARTALRYSFAALLSALGRHRWANLVPHSFGDHAR
jgi:hypothetical protein